MNRFLGFLVFVAFLMLLLIAMLNTLPSCEAAEPLHLTISADPLPPPYPPEVYRIPRGLDFGMSPNEFYAWAVKRNAEERAEWDKWHATAPPRWINYGVTDYKQSRRGSYFGSNNEQGSVRHSERRFLNPDYRSRPLTIINPYCQPKNKAIPVRPMP